ncbi:DUF748 domain-containing protein [Wenzhouxiangellaceae bacterium CH-27]|uniref:DUF748 domain-containing protein n=1 Tax=Elongatibacter sediminis TaxID=3119006 RepID=A0AAW9RA62_9GAMM
MPRWIESFLTDISRDLLGHTARSERIAVNPWTLVLEVEGFALDDPDGTTWLSFDHLRINLQVSGLFRRAWTLREFHLDGPRLRIERFGSGETRLGRVLASLPESQAEDAPESGSLPRLLISDFSITGGAVRVVDAVPEPAQDLSFAPIEIRVSDLSTLEEREGDKAIAVELPGGATLRLNGKVHLAPTEIAGSLRVERADLAPVLPYLRSAVAVDALEAWLTAGFDYRLSWPAGAGPVVELSDLELVLADVAVSAASDSGPLLRLEEVRATGGRLGFPQRRAGFDSLRVAGLSADIRSAADGRLNLQSLAVRPGAAAAPDPDAIPPDVSGAPVANDPGQGPVGWDVTVDSVDLVEGRVAFEDRAFDPPAALVLDRLNLAFENVGNQPDTEIPFDGSAVLAGGGEVNLNGRASVLPEISATAGIEVREIPVGLAQPWVSRASELKFESGLIEAGIEAVWSPDGAKSAAGTVTVSRLEVVDARDGQPLIGWERLGIERFELDLTGRDLNVTQVDLAQPQGRLTIHEDLSTNLSGLMSGPEGAADGESDAESGWGIRIARIGIADGGLDFADRSLPLPFATRIRQLDGHITTLDTGSAAPGEVELEGQVDEYGLARASGTLDAMDPLRDTDMRVEFRNLDLSSLSPYSVGFAGREIDEGQLDLDLGYRIEAGVLKASNDVVISDLVLGQKVDHPGAASLPLGLAVALLTDSNGVIDIELPVEGDVNDPEFRLGGVIWKAVAGLITKVVTAPFKLLAGLVGAESGDLGEISFLAGRSDLPPPAREKVAQLREALTRRPELAIEVPGTYVEAIDAPVLQFRDLRRTVLDRLGKPEGAAEANAGADAEATGIRDDMLDGQVRGVLEQLHRERFPESPLEAIRAEHSAPPVDDPEGVAVLDELAYAIDLRERLVQSQPVEQGELDALGEARAVAVRAALLADGGLDENRVALGPVVPGESEDGDWVVIELEVAAD